MQITFLSIALCGGVYFLIRKRRFDYFTLAFFSAIIYFMPGFFGSTAYHVDGVWRYSDIVADTYLIMASVLLSIWLSAAIFTNAGGVVSNERPRRVDYYFINCVLLMALVGLLGTLLTASGKLFSPEKDIVMEGLGRWHILFYSSATLGLPVAYALDRYKMAMAFLGLLIFDLYIGFRVAFAIGVLSALVVYLYGCGRCRLIKMGWKSWLMIFSVGVLFFLYKSLGYSIKYGNWDLVFEMLLSPDIYVDSVRHSEPFIIQNNLNEIILNNFKTSPDHIFDVIYQATLFANNSGVEIVSFNDIFQPILFPEVEYGLAGNIWAQMWSVGGWVLLILFLILFNIVISVGNRTLQARRMVVRAGLAPVFCYWCFYIHRNDIGYAINLEKRQLIVFVVAMIVALLIYRRPRMAMN